MWFRSTWSAERYDYLGPAISKGGLPSLWPFLLALLSEWVQPVTLDPTLGSLQAGTWNWSLCPPISCPHQDPRTQVTFAERFSCRPFTWLMLKGEFSFPWREGVNAQHSHWELSLERYFFSSLPLIHHLTCPWHAWMAKGCWIIVKLSPYRYTQRSGTFLEYISN